MSQQKFSDLPQGAKTATIVIGLLPFLFIVGLIGKFTAPDPAIARSERREAIREAKAAREVHNWEIGTESFCRSEARAATSPKKIDFGPFGGDVIHWTDEKTVAIGFDVANSFGGSNSYKIWCKQNSDGSHELIQINRMGA